MAIAGSNGQQFDDRHQETAPGRRRRASGHQRRANLIERRIDNGTRKRPSINTRCGGRVIASAVSSASRPSSSGAHRQTRAIGQHRIGAGQHHAGAGTQALHRRARAAGPVIHWLSPLAMAVRPSRLIASLTRTNGKPCSMRLMKPTFKLARLAFQHAALHVRYRPPGQTRSNHCQPLVD